MEQGATLTQMEMSTRADGLTILNQDAAATSLPKMAARW